jgi:tetratricopeptide (TPR) repeat protein
VEPTSFAPEVVSHYRILRPLGAGGMGEVYLATDITLGRQVAIKFVGQGTADESSRRRLLREAQAAAALDHPNICAVHEIGSENQRSFIVMQFCEGETLAERLRRGPLPVPDALDVLAQVADALAFAHRRGIVHRDVKPQNIIIGPEGRVKVLDFGLAKPLDMSAAGTAANLTETQLTEYGSPVGTAAYMAPEQVRCGPIDGRTDLFSTGVVLYECLTGQRPFGGATVYEVLEGICHGEPPFPSSLEAAVSPALERLCLQLLAKSPADRPASAEQVRDALREMRGDDEAKSATRRRFTGRWPLRPLRRRQRRILTVTGLVVVALVLLVGAAYWRGRPQPLPPPAPDAARWYELGVAALGDGAYQQARRALETAVQIDPRFPLAHARLAEAHAELDEMDLAARALLTVTQLVPDRSRLPEADRLYLDAITAMVQRQGAEAAAAYARFAQRRPGDPHLLVDLGRAYEIVPDQARAEESYTAALTLDPQFAAAFLRRGVLRGQRQDAEGALADFAAAERFYRAASAIENETEVHLQRGLFLLTVRLADAGREMERARELAVAASHPHHQVRALLGLGHIALLEGRFDAARTLAEDAVSLASGMHGARVNSVIELGNIHAAAGRYGEAEKRYREALELAGRLRTPRAEARARLSLASTLVTLADERLDEGQRLAEEAIGFYRRYRFVREASQALAVLGRAADIRGDLDQSDRAFTELLELGRGLGNEGLVAEALDGLASSKERRGLLLESLTHLDAALAAFDRLGNTLASTYGCLRRTNLLIQLGRRDAAEEQLAQLERAAVKAGRGFASLRPWLQVLHGRLALTGVSAPAAATHACAVEEASFDDENWRVDMWSLCAAARARQGRTVEAGRAIGEALRRVAAHDPIARADVLAIHAEVLARAGQVTEAAATGREALAVYSRTGNDEAQWRVCRLLASMAAESGGRHDDEFSSCAETALGRLKERWGQEELAQYLARADFQEIERRGRTRVPRPAASN